MGAPVIDTPDGPVGLAAARIRVFKPNDPDSAAELIETIRRPIEYLPPTELRAEVSADPTQTACFADAVSIDSITVSRPQQPTDSYQLWMQIRSLPTCGLPGCFRARITTGEGDQIWLTTNTTLDATSDEAGERYLIDGSWNIPPVDAERIAASETIDLLLVPDPEGA